MTLMFSLTSEHCDGFDLFEQMPSHAKANERRDTRLHHREAYCSDTEVFWSNS